MTLNMEYRICDAEMEMIPSIAVLEDEIFSEPWSEYTLSYHLPDEYHDFIVAVDEDDNVAGYLIMSIAADVGELDNIAVAELYRRQGLADRMIEECLNRANKRGLDSIFLEVRESNTPARNLYEKYGFQIVGKRKNYYEKPREDAILMTLFLRENEETQ